jgi:hypothetical protein
MNNATIALELVSDLCDKISVLHILVLATYFYYSLASTKTSSLERLRDGKHEAQRVFLRRGVRMPQIVAASLAPSTILPGANKRRRKLIAAFCKVSDAVFMLPPHSENLMKDRGRSMGHPDIPLGFESVAADLFCRGSLSFDLSIGHMLTRSGGGPIADGSLYGHRGSIQGVCVVGNGQRLVSASYDNSLRVWDLANLSSVAAIDAHAGWVTGITTVADTGSGDAALIATSSADALVRVFDTNDFERPPHEFRGHTAWVLCVVGFAVESAAGGDRSVFVLSGSADCTLKLWGLRSLSCLGTLTGHGGAVNGVAVLGAVSDRAVSGSTDGTVKIWNLATLSCTHTLRGHRGLVSCVAGGLTGLFALSG